MPAYYLVVQLGLGSVWLVSGECTSIFTTFGGHCIPYSIRRNRFRFTIFPFSVNVKQNIQ